MVRLGSKPFDQALTEAAQRAKAETDATDQLAELQREAPDLAGRRMRYPGSASRARRPSTRPGPGPLNRRAERMRPARAESRASAHLRRLPDLQLAELLNVSQPGPLLIRCRSRLCASGRAGQDGECPGQRMTE